MLIAGTQDEMGVERGLLRGESPSYILQFNLQCVTSLYDAPLLVLSFSIYNIVNLVFFQKVGILDDKRSICGRLYERNVTNYSLLARNLCSLEASQDRL